MNHLYNPLNSGYQFKPSEYFSSGWNIFKKGMGPLVGMTLLFFVIQIVLSSIPFVNFAAGFVNSVLYAGFFIYLANLMRKKESASQFFEGFKFIFDIILFRLVFFAFIIPMILLIFAIGFPVGDLFQVIMGNMSGEEFVEVFSGRFVEGMSFLFLGMFAVFIVVIYLTVSYIFTIPLIVNHSMGFWEAMELSRKVVGMNFFGYFFSIILLSLMIIVPIAITCGIGVLFIVPLYFCITHAAYVSIFKPEELNGINDLDEFGKQDNTYNSESEFK